MFLIDSETLDKAANFISDIKTTIGSSKVDELDFELINFKAVNHQQMLATVDGSHYSLKGSSFVFSALRSGIHYYAGRKLIKESIGRVKLEILTKENYLSRHKEYFINVTNDNPQSGIEFEKVTERIRTLLEWDKIKQLIQKLNEGDIILFDGSLISGVVSTNKHFFEQLCEKAKKKGIILAGLSKDSTITKWNVPVPKLLKEYADRNKVTGSWFAYYAPEDTFFVKFRKHLDMIFRLDLVLPDNVTPKEAISYIGSYCYDPGIPAYPYPLESIHEGVMISKLQFEKCLEEFKQVCLEKGVSLDFVDSLLSIYHDELDILASGR